MMGDFAVYYKYVSPTEKSTGRRYFSLWGENGSLAASDPMLLSANELPSYPYAVITNIGLYYVAVTDNIRVFVNVGNDAVNQFNGILSHVTATKLAGVEYFSWADINAVIDLTNRNQHVVYVGLIPAASAGVADQIKLSVNGFCYGAEPDTAPVSVADIAPTVSKGIPAVEEPPLPFWVRWFS